MRMPDTPTGALAISNARFNTPLRPEGVEEQSASQKKTVVKLHVARMKVERRRLAARFIGDAAQMLLSVGPTLEHPKQFSKCCSWQNWLNCRLSEEFLTHCAISFKGLYPVNSNAHVPCGRVEHSISLNIRSQIKLQQGRLFTIWHKVFERLRFYDNFAKAHITKFIEVRKNIIASGRFARLVDPRISTSHGHEAIFDAIFPRATFVGLIPPRVRAFADVHEPISRFSLGQHSSNCMVRTLLQVDRLRRCCPYVWESESPKCLFERVHWSLLVSSLPPASSPTPENLQVSTC